jgi:hypothetical protein
MPRKESNRDGQDRQEEGKRKRVKVKEGRTIDSVSLFAFYLLPFAFSYPVHPCLILPFSSADVNGGALFGVFLGLA